MKKYTLSIGALFKNEAHSIQEWLEHYLSRGVEHFYLINDKSTDNFMEKIEKYIDKISLFNADFTNYVGRQKDMYNTYILPKLKETKWLLMVDLDEYMWSPICKSLPDVLITCNHLSQIQVCHTLFGSNGHIKQPDNIVKSFTKRANDIEGGYKYFVNSDYDFISLNVHHATYVNENDGLNKFIILGPDYFRLNHYSCQSLEFWENVKCKRGDSDNYRNRTLDDFYKLDFNEIEDMILANSI